MPGASDQLPARNAWLRLPSRDPCALPARNWLLEKSRGHGTSVAPREAGGVTVHEQVSHSTSSAAAFVRRDLTRQTRTAPQTFVPIRRILCAVDFSDCSRAAVQHAVALGEPTAAEILGLFVLPFAFPPGDDVGSWGSPVPPDAGVVSAATADLNAFLRPARQAGLTTRALVTSGECVGHILAQARGDRADVIVMGTHARSGLERLVLGSTTTNVLPKAPCPILTVSRQTMRPRPDAVAHSGNILCALDMTKGWHRTLSYALELGRSIGAPVTLLHVLEPDGRTRELAPRAAEIRGRLHAAAHASMPESVTDEMVVTGWARHQIVHVADVQGPALIVLGSHGNLGSTADHVVREASVPVLTFPQLATARES